MMLERDWSVLRVSLLPSSQDTIADFQLVESKSNGWSIFHGADNSVMKLQIRVDESGNISDVKFKTFGCGSAIASSSYMTERVKGMSLEQAGAVKNTEIAKELCLPPVKRAWTYSQQSIRADRQFTAHYSLKTLSSRRSKTTRARGRSD